MLKLVISCTMSGHWIYDGTPVVCYERLTGMLGAQAIKGAGTPMHIDAPVPGKNTNEFSACLQQVGLCSAYGLLESNEADCAWQHT